MTSVPGRLKRRLAVAAVLAVIALIAFAVWLSATIQLPESGPATWTSSTSSKSADSTMLPLGVRLDEDGSIELFVPDCPGVKLSAVQWMSLEIDQPVIWAIELKPGGVSTNRFTVGETPPGYVTYTQLRPGTSIEDFGTKWVSFVVPRRSNAGERLSTAGLTIKANELPPGVLVYRSRDNVLHRVPNASHFRPPVRCDAG